MRTAFGPCACPPEVTCHQLVGPFLAPVFPTRVGLDQAGDLLLLREQNKVCPPQREVPAVFSTSARRTFSNRKAANAPPKEATAVGMTSPQSFAPERRAVA